MGAVVEMRGGFFYVYCYFFESAVVGMGGGRGMLNRGGAAGDQGGFRYIHFHLYFYCMYVYFIYVYLMNICMQRRRWQFRVL